MPRIRDDVLLLDPAEYRVMPWKNGGGTTREIHAHGSTDQGFDWRLSIADVAGDGPFSLFAGYARTIMLLDGRGMRLSFGDTHEVRIDERFQPVDFDGGADALCTLIDGPVRDFNIMSARARVRHEHAIIRDFPFQADLLRNTGGDAQAIHCLAGSLRVTLDDHTRITVEHGATLLQFAARAIREIDAAPGSVALSVHFHRAG